EKSMLKCGYKNSGRDPLNFLSSWNVFKEGSENPESIEAGETAYNQSPKEIQELVQALIDEYIEENNRLPKHTEQQLLNRIALKEAQFSRERMDYAAQTRELIGSQLAAETDSLTGLLNIRGLEARMEQVLATAERKGEPIACLFFDLDQF